MPEIFGTADADVLQGGPTGDVIHGAGGGDTIRGGDGDDILYAYGLTVGTDDGTINFLYGDAGNDYLWSDLGNDVLDGGDGNDTLSGSAGDTFLGGGGADKINVMPMPLTRPAVTSVSIIDAGSGDDLITLNEGFFKVTGGAGADRIEDIFSYWRTGYATITDFNPTEGDRLSLGVIDDEYNTRFFRGDIQNPGFILMTGQAYSPNDYGLGYMQIWTWFDGSDTYLMSDADGSGTLSDADTIVRFSGKVAIDPSIFFDTPLSKIELDGSAGADVYAGTAGNDQYRALGGNDLLHGGAGNDELYGGNGDDFIWGDEGDDHLWGGLGDDKLDGGSGVDGAVYYGRSSNYTWAAQPDGSWTLTGAEDSDTLRNIDYLAFSDRTVWFSPLLPADVATAYSSILRQSAARAYVTGPYSMASDVLAAGGSPADAINVIIRSAGATTSVATLTYEFFTGKIPSSAGVTYLVSPIGPNPNNLNSAYYQSFNLENRYINFAVNLGKVGEGKDAFAAKYGSMNLFDATREAYKTIFGAAPTDSKIHALIDTRADYFAAYGGDGANGVGTKAAMVGWLLAEAQKADLGVMVRSNDAWLTDLADGSAPFAIDIVDPAKGYYKSDFIFGG